MFGSLSKTLFFEYQDIRALTGYFLEAHYPKLAEVLGIQEEFVATVERSQTPVSAIESIKMIADSRKRFRFVPLPDSATEETKESQDLGFAIIGVSGRYPQAENIQEFWENLRNGKDSVTEIPAERWDHLQYYHPDKHASGSTYSKWGGFLEGVDRFDPLFFNISPREAEIMDPQERLFLQCVYETLQDAGYTRQSLAASARRDAHGVGGQVGVYVGVMYEEYQLYGAQETLLGRSMALGASPSSIANRVSYFCDFHGPSVAVDTMCSSSLTAIHFACQSLRQGECAVAIAGGVNLSLHPNKYLLLAQGKFASSTGRCESFGMGGDGYVPAEGVGAVLLKPLAQARADGDHIYGIIKGSAINHGGKTNGYSVPNPVAQAEVIDYALKQAGIEASQVSYIEAHGTGTALGDPIEITALSRVYGTGQEMGETEESRSVCAIGSVKSNIGHAESAAGIAGLTKILLQMKYGELVPSLHSQTLNPHIDFAGSVFRVQQEREVWRRQEREGREEPRRAGLSSFGAGGSNAHLVIEEEWPAVEVSARQESVAREERVLILVSARSEEQLREQARRLVEAIERGEVKEEELEELAYTLQVGREGMEERLGMLVSRMQEVKERLQGYIQGRAEGIMRGQVSSNKETLNLFSSDDELQEAVLKWMQDGKYEKLLNLWVIGMTIVWERLYQGRRIRRLSLPTYPFARERYWLPQLSASVRIGTVPGVIGAMPSDAATMIAALHPLVHRNISDLNQQRYRSTFSGQEFFLRDHQVEQQAILPAVASLEMARAAAQLAWGEEDEPGSMVLRQVVWVRPVVAEAAVSVEIEFEPQDDGSLRYQLTGVAPAGEDEVLYSQGQIEWEHRSECPRLDLEAIRLRCQQRVWSGQECYERYEQIGLRYGVGMRAVEEVRAGQGEALGRLVLPGVVAGTRQDYVLHPSMLDGALHTALGVFVEGGSSEVQVPWLPYALEQVEIYGGGEAQMWAWVRRVEGASVTGEQVRRLDIDLCDDAGVVRVGLRGLVTRPLVTASGSMTLPTFHLFRPHWQRVLEESEVALVEEERVLWLLGGSPEQAHRMQALLPAWRCQALRVPSREEGSAERYMAGCVQMIEQLQRELRGRGRRGLLGQLVVPVEQPGWGGLAGILKTAHLEQPKFQGQLLEVEDLEHREQEVAAAVRLLAQRPQMTQAALRAGQLWQLGWQLMESSASVSIPWKEGGVYVLTGGAGGLGRLLAKEIGQRATGVSVVLTGRRAYTEEELEALRREIGAGVQVEYRRMDVGNGEEVRAVLKEIEQTYGRVNGIIHSAGQLRDSYVLAKQEESVREVLWSKVAGVVALDEGSREMKLDCFVLYSSLAGCVGNVGQADYAAANGFLDAYARMRNEQVRQGKRTGKTIALDWPLWQHGGMHISPETVAILQGQDRVALSTSNGMHVLYQAMASDADQVMITDGDLEQAGISIDEISSESPTIQEIVTQEPFSQDVSLADPDMLRDQTVAYLKREIATVIKVSVAQLQTDAPLEVYGMDSILAMQFTNQLEKTFGTLSKTLFFEYQTISELSRYFLDVHREVLTTILNQGKRETPTRSVPTAPTVISTARSQSRFVSRLARSRQQPGRRPVQPATSEALDIAIIGLAGRYPGANTLREFWENLCEGKDGVTEIPAERWDHSLYYHPDKHASGSTYSKWGGFLEGVDRFDPLFFNISPREAEIMDPQERLFLQCAYETLQDAGYTRQSLAASARRNAHGVGGQVGVYVGVMYEEYQLYGAQETLLGRSMALGASPSSIANRVSYFCNFHGPCMAVDTMCSSSLTAIHLACQSLRQGESAVAIAGGVNLSLHPNKYLLLAQGNFVSSTGRCESFGMGGDGYVPAEGVGAVLLKPLAQARADGDHIYGIIKGSAINHGGKTNGYSVPNPVAQAEVIDHVLKQAGIEASQVSYIEAHGTGTALGDPIEIAALSRVYGTGQEMGETGESRSVCAIGSVKSNIGHAESASGIAGLTKVLLQMKYGELVPSLHSQTLNPHIDFAGSVFRVQQEREVWRRQEREGREEPRRAGLSSFGAGGSNAHLVIEEEWPEVEVSARQESVALEERVLILVSARSEKQLQEQARRLVEAIERGEVKEEELEELAYTLQVGREGMEERLGMLVSRMQEVKERLQDYIQGRVEGIMRGQVKPHREMVEVLKADEDMQQMLAIWIAKRKYEKLLEVWVKGMDVDWERLYQGRSVRRLSLPTYPFARERYWLSRDISTLGRDSVHAISDNGRDCTSDEERIIQRRTSFLQKHWEPCMPSHKREIEGPILILTAQDTMELATCMQQRYPQSVIVNVHNLEAFLQQEESSIWLDYTGFIDLLGCSHQTHDSLSWISLWQRCIANSNERKMIILCITQGLEAFQNTSINLAGALHAGLARTLQAEYKQIQVRHIDLAVIDDISLFVHQIIDELSYEDGNVEVCYRGGQRYRAYLNECQVEQDNNIPQTFSPDHVLWITGGTRGLGYLCAQHFVTHYGVKRLVLTGQDALPPYETWDEYQQQETAIAQKIRNIRALEDLGATVSVLAVPLHDESALEKALRQVNVTMGPIGGLIHCAGISDADNPAFIRKTLEEMQRIFQPKVNGLNTLYRVLRQEPLQFFVLFSSVSAAIPMLAVGQSDYATANAYMDYFAQAHQQEGRIVSIQWPNWKEAGMGEVTNRIYQETGLQSLTNEEGMRLLDQNSGPAGASSGVASGGGDAWVAAGETLAVARGGAHGDPPAGSDAARARGAIRGGSGHAGGARGNRDMVTSSLFRGVEN